MAELETGTVPIGDLVPYHQNPRHGDVGAISESLTALDQYRHIVVNRGTKTGRTNEVLAGNHTMKAAKALGWDTIQVSWVDVDDDTAARIVLADNRTNDLASYDDTTLVDVLRDLAESEHGLTATGFDGDDLDDLIAEIDAEPPAPTRPLSSDFGVPPFTVLDARQGYWTQRKREWKEKGLVGEVGREETTVYDMAEEYRGTMADVSVFDPVLTELSYRWFCPAGGHILDPFAGGPTRGVVASELGYRYTGVEIRPEQVEASRENARLVLGDGRDDLWVLGDSTYLDGGAATGDETTEPGWQNRIASEAPYDMIFSCPPYYDLEEYSGGAGDGSMHATYEAFLDWYRAIIAAQYRLLADNRFAVYVVGEIRDKEGVYRNFVGDTITAFLDAGFGYYNEAVLVTPVGTASLRARGYMKHRKLAKTHQNVLVFWKGDPRAVADHFPVLDEGIDWGVPDVAEVLDSE